MSHFPLEARCPQGIHAFHCGQLDTVALASHLQSPTDQSDDDQFESFVDRFARRVSTFDRQALADIRHFVNNVSLPADEEFPPQMDAFWEAVARPVLQSRASKAFADGLQQRSDVELHLASAVARHRCDECCDAVPRRRKADFDQAIEDATDGLPHRKPRRGNHWMSEERRVSGA